MKKPLYVRYGPPVDKTPILAIGTKLPLDNKSWPYDSDFRNNIRIDYIFYNKNASSMSYNFYHNLDIFPPREKARDFVVRQRSGEMSSSNKIVPEIEHLLPTAVHDLVDYFTINLSQSFLLFLILSSNSILVLPYFSTRQLVIYMKPWINFNNIL